MRHIGLCFLLSLLVGSAAALNCSNVTCAPPVPDPPLIVFSSNFGGGGGGGGGAFAAFAAFTVLAQEVVTIDSAVGASVSVEGAVVNIPAGAFSGAVTVTVIMLVFNAGTSAVVGVVRAPVMKFNVVGGQAQAPISIVFIISFRRRQVASGNKLFMNWLNKKTNAWTPICAPSSLDPLTGEFTTETPPEVFNDPAFNPSSGCAPDLLGPCDGSGGEFTVFEMPESSTCSTPAGGGLSDGAIAGIAIGVVAGLALIATSVWWFTAKSSQDQAKEGAVLSSLVLGQEDAKPPPRPAGGAPVMPPPPAPFFGDFPAIMPPPAFFGGSPPVLPLPVSGGSPPTMTGGMPLPVMPMQSYPVSGAPYFHPNSAAPLPF